MAIYLKWFFYFFTSFSIPNTTVSESGTEAHPYYVSVTELNHNQKDNVLEISCKIFTNDLETILRQKSNSYIDILHPKNKSVVSKLISDYISDHLKININGSNFQLEYLGYEIEEEAVWSYLQIRDIQKVKKIIINNSLLYDYKKEQINLMHVNVDGERKSAKVTNPETTVIFNY